MTFKEILALVESGIILALMIALMIKPSEYTKAFSNGLALFAMNVLPTMFPYLFFTKILTLTGFSEKLGKILKTPLKAFGLPPCCGFVWAMSIISGCPVGAKLSADLYKEGAIDQNAVKTLSALTSISGPVFVLGTVGSAIFNNAKIGVIVYVSNMIACFINGLIWKRKGEIKDEKIITYAKSSNLGDSAYDTVITVLIVGGYIALFNMLADMLTDFGLLEYLAFLLDKIPAIGKYKLGIGISYGLIEITRGAVFIANSPISDITISVLSSIIALGGLSVAIQSITFLKQCKVGALSYLVRKFTQAGLSFFFAFGICCLNIT